MDRAEQANPANVVPTSASSFGARQRYLEEVERRRLAVLEQMSDLPVAVLIWGPAVDSGTPVSVARQMLKDELGRRNHVANFSEELYDSDLPFSLIAQQVSHVQSHDITFSMPELPSSIAEIHDFANMPDISHKIVTFLDRQWNDGYANRTLLEFQSNVTCRVQLYDAQQLPHCIVEYALKQIKTLQEIHYIHGRRI